MLDVVILELSPRNGSLNAPGPAQSNSPELNEIQRIETDAATNLGFDVKAFFVRNICSHPGEEALAGFSYPPESIAHGFPPDVFIGEFGTNSANCELPTTSNNPFPSNVAAHELGHHFGLYPKTKSHHYPENDPSHLMSPGTNFIIQTLSSGRCEINFFEWEQLHGNPNLANVKK